MHRSSTLRRATQGVVVGMSVLTAAFTLTAAPANAAAPPANATAAVDAVGLTYTGLGGANNVSVSLVGGRFVITDSAPITAGAGCLPTAKGVFEVSCQAPKTATGLIKPFRVNGGGGDDVIANTTSITMRADGSSGNDLLEGGSGTDVLTDSFGKDHLRGNGGTDNLGTELSQNDGLTDTLEGGAGDDDLQAGPANDILRGGTGDDTMRGGLGADEFDGGSGVHDEVVYLDNGHDPFDRLVISIDGNADDGLRELGATQNEGDFVRTNVEDVFGGHGNDVILGSASGNLLSGNLGNDTITGGLGQDQVLGGPGSDTLASNQLFGVPVADGAIDTVNGGSDTDYCRVPFAGVEADVTIDCETVDQD